MIPSEPQRIIAAPASVASSIVEFDFKKLFIQPRTTTTTPCSLFTNNRRHDRWVAVKRLQFGYGRAHAYYTTTAIHNSGSEIGTKIFAIQELLEVDTNRRKGRQGSHR
jgi:hypothetical protein